MGAVDNIDLPDGIERGIDIGHLAPAGRKGQGKMALCSLLFSFACRPQEEEAGGERDTKSSSCPKLSANCF